MIIEFSISILFTLLFLYLLITGFINHFKEKVEYKKIFLNFCIFISFILIISQTLFPIRFSDISKGFEIYNSIPFKVLYEIYTQYSFGYFLYQVVGNIVLFIPFGYFIYLKYNTRKFNIVLIGFLVSFIIECIQGFIPYRFSEIDDIILNTLGTYLGIYICIILDKIYLFISRVKRARNRSNSK